MTSNISLWVNEMQFGLVLDHQLSINHYNADYTFENVHKAQNEGHTYETRMGMIVR